MPSSLTCVKATNESVSMTQIPVPDTPGPGEALVRPTLTTVCGSDIHLLEGMLPPGAPMGHEAVGVVEAVGDGVPSLKEGDRVAISCLQCCGYCDRCLEGNHSVCQTFGAPMNLVFGAQGEHIMIRGAQSTLAKIPDTLEDEQVLFVTDIMSTGFAAVERSGMRAGDTVAVFAQGPVGLCATAGARTLGAGTIITVESIPERVAMSKRLGADVVLEPADAVAKIMEITAGTGADVAIEALGRQETFENCCAVTRHGGTVSSVGVYGQVPVLNLPTTGTFIHRTLVTTFCPVGTERLTRLMALIAGKKVDLTPLITHHLPLSETPAAYDMFRSHADGVMKIALKP